MALILCPECNQQVSDTVDKCPHCGYELKETSGVIANVAENTTNTTSSKKSKKPVIAIVIALIVVIIAISVVVVVKTNKSKNYEKTYSEAKEKMDAYDYAAASKLLESIPEYKDSKKLIDEAETGEFLSGVSQHIFNFIKDGGFYNPSAVRLLNASYTTSKTDSNAELLKADYIIYFQIQGTNKLGGTLTKEFVYVSGGDSDDKIFTNDESGWDYSKTEKTVDYALINKMLQKYWEDAGIAD